MPGRQARAGTDVRRPAAVLLLVAIAAVGLRAGGAFRSTRSPGVLQTGLHVLYWAAVVAGGALVVLDLVIIGAWLVWARGGGTRLPRPARRRRSPWWLLILPLEVFALARVIAILRRRFAGGAAAAGAHAGRAGSAAHGPHLLLPPGSSWPLLTALAIAALAAAALVLPGRRRGRRAIPPEPPAGPGEPLLAALAAGAGALRDDHDPRAAIVNCYAAMEDSLAAAGSAPAAADTPAEVLARASAAGLLRSAAADTLTGLFRQARYSTHPVTDADRLAAQDALSRIRADLGAPA